MKKILFYILIISLSIFSQLNLTNADIIGKDLGLELYKSIDEGFNSLVDTQFKYELSGQGQGSIKNTVNNILGNNIECDITTVDEIITIADSEDKNQIQTIVDKCSPDGTKISLASANSILITMTNIKLSYKERARDKVKNMYELSKIGLYSDGNDSNSPFDLMSDIKAINEIIFSEQIEYKEDWSGANYNDGWPCNDFFCIKLEYEEGNYGLSTGSGKGTKSIKDILTVVINHFKKFANTSWIQSKMAADNFEISAIIPNLSELFRGFSIETIQKPVPIFEKTEDTNRKDKTATATEKRLDKYYINRCLDYNRRNDLDEITQYIEMKRQIQKSIYRDPPSVSEDPLKPICDASNKNNSFSSKNIDRKTMTNDLKDFYNQFSELQRFTLSITQFSKDVFNLIKKILEIPVRSN